MNRPRILFVDDNSLLADTWRQALGEYGYRVDVALNGMEAVDIFSRNPGEDPVAIIDLNMPGMHGTDTIAALQYRQPKVKVIAMSGQCMGSCFRRLADLGVRHFRPKPFSADELIEDISDVLSLGANRLK